MARLVGKNNYQNDTGCNDFGLCAQNIDITLGSKTNTIGGPI